MSPPPSPQHVLDTFHRAGRSIDAHRAQGVVEAIRAHGALDAAAAALANDERAEALADLLAYAAAIGEARDPALRILRLRRDAEALDARAEPLWREAAEFHGRAAYRRAQGDIALADQFLARAAAAERLAAQLEAEALQQRLQAGALTSGRAFADLLHALAA